MKDFSNEIDFANLLQKIRDGEEPLEVGEKFIMPGNQVVTCEGYNHPVNYQSENHVVEMKKSAIIIREDK